MILPGYLGILQYRKILGFESQSWQNHLFCFLVFATYLWRKTLLYVNINASINHLPSRWPSGLRRCIQDVFLPGYLGISAVSKDSWVRIPILTIVFFLRHLRSECPCVLSVINRTGLFVLQLQAVCMNNWLILEVKHSVTKPDTVATSFL